MSGPGAPEPGHASDPAMVGMADVRNATTLFMLGHATAEQCHQWATVLLSRDDVTIDETFGETTRDVLKAWADGRRENQITLDSVSYWQTILDFEEFA